METFFVPTEQDFRKWIKEAIIEYLDERTLPQHTRDTSAERLLTRKEIAKTLQVSLVTLTDWVKRGLPSHKQRGRVYFLYSEVMVYLRSNRPASYFNAEPNPEEVALSQPN